jgi:ferric-dicitrate binding protein FerR (iron transport regulator)
MTHDDLTPDEAEDARRAAEALRAPRAAAPAPAFRARLKDAFVSGAIDQDARPIAARRPGGRAARFPLALAGAVAAVLVVASAFAFNPGPQWRVAQMQNAHGNVIVNDDAIPADDIPSLNEALVPGARIEWDGDGDLELLSRGRLALGIVPGTRMTLPAPPPRWFLRHSEARIETGTIRLTSGPRFHGARVTIATPEARIEMTGTTLAVIHEPMGTCVCVLEGSVHVMAGTHDMGMVPAGQRQVVFASGAPPVRAEMRPTERVALGEMRTKIAAELTKGGD